MYQENFTGNNPQSTGITKCRRLLLKEGLGEERRGVGTDGNPFTVFDSLSLTRPNIKYFII